MQAPRAPLYVFFAAFLTFLIAFAFLLVYVKPELDKRRKQESNDPAASAPANASLPGASEPRPEPRRERDSAPVPAEKPATSGAVAGGIALDLRGRVVDGRSSGVSGAKVQLFVTAKDAKPESSIVIPTRGDGTFAAHVNVPAHGAFLQATAPGFARSEKKLLSAADAPAVDVGNLVVRAGGSLRIRVTGARSGAISGAKVALLPAIGTPAPADGDYTATTEADGSAVLRGIDVGTWLVRVTAEGHADGDAEWKFDATGKGATEQLNVALLPLSAWVSGTAVDSEGSPVTSGEVTAKLVRGDSLGTQEWRAKVDSKGRFKIGPLPRGSYETTLVAPGLAQKGRVVADAEGAPVELVAEHSGSVGGRIVCSADHLPAAPRITIWKADGNGRLQPFDGAYRAEGERSALRFHVDGLGAGRYVVRVACEGFAPGRSAPFNLVVGQPLPELEVTVGEGGRIGGAIVDSRGVVAPGARVTAFEGMAPPMPAFAELFPADARATRLTDGQGGFELDRLSPGLQVIVIESPGQPARTIGPLLVAEGRELRLGTLTLGGGTILSVTVEDGAGKPIPYGRGEISTLDGTVQLSFVADDEGNFCLRGLAEGDYVLTGADGKVGRAELTLRANETGRARLSLRSR
jgi:hypothetical protein